MKIVIIKEFFDTTNDLELVKASNKPKEVDKERAEELIELGFAKKYVSSKNKEQE